MERERETERTRREIVCGWECESERMRRMCARVCMCDTFQTEC
jgi:hypothetical protein